MCILKNICAYYEEYRVCILTNITKTLPHLLILVIFIVINIINYKYKLRIKNENDKLTSLSYLDSVGNLLVRDLKSVSNTSDDYSKLFLFKNFSTKKYSVNHISSTEDIFNIKPYAVYVKNAERELVLDLQELRENLNQIFPAFLGYAIAINNSNIVLEVENNQILNVQKDYKIDLNNTLNIKVGIKPGSSFNLLNKEKLFNNQLFIFFCSLLGCLLFLYFYLKKKQEIEKRLDILESDLCNERKINTSFTNSKRASQFLTKLFIKKATEIYIKHETGISNGTENIVMQNIVPCNYLFPMSLYDSSSSTIDLPSLIKSLEEYFAPYFITTAIRIKNNIDKIEINCAMEILYQLLFSLIFNLIEFMDKQSDTPKMILINFTKQKIIIEYDSFPLDEEKMTYLSEAVISEYGDIFLLSCGKLFKSLNEHQFKYKISSSLSKNMIEILYPTVKKEKKEIEDGLVLDFSKYAKRTLCK